MKPYQRYPFYPFSIGWDGRGWSGGNPNPWLSLKAMFKGPAVDQVQNGMTYEVDDGSWLILNEGHGYTLEKSWKQNVLSCCIFWPPALAADVFRHSDLPSESLLADPHAPGCRTGLIERLYPHDNTLTPILKRLAAMDQDVLGWQDRLKKEELLIDILRRVVRYQGDAHKEMDSLKSVKASTREELYRRLYRGRDYLAAMCRESVTIDEVARIAAMSSSHFLAKFKELFAESPYQFLSRRRIELSKSLLKRTDFPVSAICREVGFQSQPSFTNTFKRHVGLSPGVYRRSAIS